MGLTFRLHQARFAGAIWLLLYAFFSYANPGHAADLWRIDDLAVLLDKPGTETITSVSEPNREAAFTPAPHGFSSGYTRSVHWLRFTLQAPLPDARGVREAVLEIHPPYVDDLQIYLSQSELSGAFEMRRGGDLLPHAAKEYPYRAFVYRINFDDARPRTAYVRLQTTSSSVLTLRLWEPQQFIEHAAREYALLGLLFGLILAGLLANIWHGLWRREPIYRRYIVYLLVTLFFLLGINGLVGEYLLPQEPIWASHWVSVTFLLLIISGTRFYTLALDIEHAAPWIRWAYRVQLGLAVLFLPAPFVDFFPEIATALLPLVLLMLSTGAWRSVQLWRQNNTNGKVLLLAHLFSLCGALSTVLTLLGLLPGQFWLIYGFQIGTVGTLLALQLMLAQHVRAIQARQTQASIDVEIAKASVQQERTERQQQRHFLSMLTHELKTPLSVIRLRLGAVSPTLRMQAHANQAVADIDAIVERCAMVSQMEEGADKVQLARCDLSELLSEILAQQQFFERVMLYIHKEVLAVPLHCDPLLLRTLISNLIDNAVRYSPPDSTTQVTALLSPEAHRHGIRIRVENPVGSAGMPDPKHLFEKYYRAPGAKRQSGSGLGLYIVKALSDQLGATVNYCPQKDRVTFELWLPT